jgi:hypothetical protein
MLVQIGVLQSQFYELLRHVLQNNLSLGAVFRIRIQKEKGLKIKEN